MCIWKKIKEKKDIKKSQKKVNCEYWFCKMCHRLNCLIYGKALPKVRAQTVS